MNLLVVASRYGSVRTLRIGATQLVVASAVSALVLVGAGLGAGIALAKGLQYQAAAEQTQLRALVHTQQRALDEMEVSVAHTLEAVVGRIGTLTAHVTRLDALGQRLTSIAGFEDGEFNFAAPPAMGGPEGPAEAFAVTAAASTGEVAGELLALQRQLDDRRGQLEALESLMVTRTVARRVEPAGWPVEGGWISSSFGRRIDPITSDRSFHAGMDFSGRAGTPVKAMADGVVTWSGPRSSYGNLVEITHGNGLVTRYAHNKDNLVRVGDRVSKGEIIAHMGATGRATGPHLHFEVLRNGRNVNPRSYVKRQARSADGA